MSLKLQSCTVRLRGEAGMTLVETLFALGMLLIVAAGIMSVATVSVVTTENQGNLGARTAEYAQDKLEQLISLNYNDTVSDTASGIIPMPTSGGTGLSVGTDCGGSAGNPCGSSDPSAPVSTPGTGFVDYLCNDGSPVGQNGCVVANWFYIRVWEISQYATNVKQITVTCQVRFGVGGGTGAASLARATVATLKTNPF